MCNRMIFDMAKAADMGWIFENDPAFRLRQFVSMLSDMTEDKVITWWRSAVSAHYALLVLPCTIGSVCLWTIKLDTRYFIDGDDTAGSTAIVMFKESQIPTIYTMNDNY